jgi:hypothetical protein
MSGRTGNALGKSNPYASHWVNGLLGDRNYGERILSLHDAPMFEILQLRRALAKPTRDLKNARDTTNLYKVQEALRVIRARVREFKRPGQSDYATKAGS